MARYIAFTLLILFFSACSIKDTQHVKLDLKIAPHIKSTIQGEILQNTNSTKDIYLVLYKHIKGDKTNFKNYKLVDFSTNSNANNKYKFNVLKGLYFLYACQNLEVLKDEKYAYEYFSDYIEIQASTQKQLDITLNSKPTIVEDSNILISSKKDISLFENSGNISEVTLKNDIFKRENSNLGLWNPNQFLEKIGGGIYLLDKYATNKKIVLFVHGMNGTPTDFTSIIKSLNRKKYFPIVYYYPTGMNLNYAVDGLKYSFDKLKITHQVKNISIVAHSMGGLVSRAFINSYSYNLKVDKFISIATPWNGQKYAKLGGDIAKSMAPSFGNMIPKSAFIENNQDIDFPSYLKHYLLFAYKGKSSLILDTSNDGVISLSSQLYNKAQNKATSIYGFNESHVGILNSKESIKFIKDILEDKL